MTGKAIRAFLLIVKKTSRSYERLDDSDQLCKTARHPDIFEAQGERIRPF
jgi:hypothetical protein